MAKNFYAVKYAEVLKKLVKEYKKLGWDQMTTIGNLTSVLVNEVDKIYRR